MKYLEGLNEAQKQAVLATEGPVSVLAGAGAGKTKVLATRIYHLIREGVPGREILAVTFTNKAAREMRERVRHLLGEDAPLDLPFIATFHGLGRELLESYGKALGLPRYFSIYDRDDSERVIAKALKALDVEARDLSPRAVLGRISRAKSDGLSREQFAEKHGRTSFGNRIASEAWRAYDTTLREEKALDFDDLLTLPVRLLESNVEARALAESRWRYIHIDEYQDTNALQGRLAGILAKKHGNLFVVGDIDQTIYTWRGATIENLLDFDRDYPSATTIILEHNYRSTGAIVESANAVIEENKNRKEKRSVTDNPVGERITLHAAGSAELEARWVAKRIRALIASGEAPESIAILLRTNFQSRAIEEALLHESIPYKLLGTRFFERKEIKDVLAWVRLALEPSRETDKIRATQAPPRGIGKVTLAKLAAGKRSELKAGERQKVEQFEACIAELSRASETLRPSLFLRMVVEKSGLRALLAEGTEEERERLENIQELASLAARHDHAPGKEGIAAFLAESALSSDQDELDRTQASGVTVMTVHAAKGLEFDTVFIAGLEEGLFPHAGMDGDKRDEEEERRLFYVALTRAKKRVLLSCAYVRKIYGTDTLSEPSSFLRDIPSQHMVYDETDGSEEVIHI